MKKFFALVLAIMMVMSLALPAAAAGYTLTLKAPVQNHIYGAYQIFSGDLHESVLSNVNWGTGIDDTKVVDSKNIYQALGELSLVTYSKNPDNTLTKNPAAKIFDGKTTAAAIADVITHANWSHDDAGLKDVAAVFGKYLKAPEQTSTAGGLDTDKLNYIYTISGLTGGYYLIKDQTVPEGTTDYDHFYTDYILHIVNNITVSAKGNVPELNKTVFNASHNQFMEYGDTYVGKQITYRLEASLPSYFAQYDSYWFRMEDKLSDGLDFVAPKRVYVLREGGVILDVTHLKDSTYGDNILEPNMLYEVKVDGRNLYVNFPNTKGTFIGKDDADNDVEFTVRYSDKFIVEYYAKLNENAIIGDAGNPNTAQLFYNNNPNDTGDGGKTPPDEPKVYTYGLKMLKVDENDETITLEGAEFQMWLNISGVKNVAMFSAPNAAGNRVFQGWIPAADIDTADEIAATTLRTDAKGNFAVVGLDVGAYRLTETKAPSGYNLLTADFNVDIKPTYTAGNLTSLVIEVNGESVAGDLATGTGVVKVVNQSGATLPSTGGMGTTLFYVIGSVLVMGALVMLITKKRMAAEN